MRQAFAALAATAVLSCSGDALALSCRDPWNEMFEPRTGSTGVPTNALVWVGAGIAARDGEGDWYGKLRSEPRPIVLVDDAGNRVAGRQVVLMRENEPKMAIHVFAPATALRAGGRYTVTVGSATSVFAVGDGPDLEAPAVPRVLESEGHYSTEWGESYGVSYTVSNEGLVTVADRELTASIAPGVPDGQVTELGCAGEAAGCSSGAQLWLWIGNGSCDAGNWPDGGRGESTSVRFGAFDVAGNFSGWSGPNDGSVPLTGCGCGASGGGPVSAAGAFVVLLGLLRRRR